MPLPKIENVRKLNDEELVDEILATKRQLFNLRFQQATRRLEKPHEFKHARHRLAQLLTVEREREIRAVNSNILPKLESTETKTP
ncbi:MAG: 50S ribosomal protein L29 [cyanobacterium endosymbiont of Rhopalodia musculus]|uniref:50S ribosomal protein L29 n=1 Tax=cyanobacterium endosymbiont of Epithemia clementina EcSB TaxID=3034674 RepID=UPI002481743A|nr:50S ribosomal protein L29 [cyanobacterium endosymbiont of Epithemia clementina EcSB]WGT67958.1 50S ribosomal protein L29 [cyanobacterium endosymbiont of Epithemia clementina EcSB]